MRIEPNRFYSLVCWGGASMEASENYRRRPRKNSTLNVHGKYRTDLNEIRANRGGEVLAKIANLSRHALIQ